jgi:hypothetical protein
MNLRRLLGTFYGIGLALTLTAPLAAGEVRDAPKAVLELFTSQGCASCPPADKILSDLKGRKDIIALSYHVNYWDYMGWRDTFGAEANSDRQRDYAASWGSGRVYTPQLVINGAENVVGSRKGDVDGAIKAASLDLPVTITFDEKMLNVDIEAKAGHSDAVVWLVTFIDNADVTIERGENSGQKISYSQVVTGHQMLGMWEAGKGAHLMLPRSEVFRGDGNGAVIMVQEENNGLPGRIIGAASIVE